MIPVFEPIIGKEEINAVIAALKRGEVSGSFGKALDEFESKFAEYVGCKYGIATTSGTTALHLAVSALELDPGDEILVSSSTNIATALAAVHNNLIPVPVDSENTTWNLDLDLIEGLITSKTKAIIPVHLFGHPVDMDKLMSIAKKHNLIVIEDCAESHGATVRGKMTGSFGDMSCFSFYANKIITTGEGGMITTNDKSLAEKMRLLRNLAFTEPRFKHQYAGYNFRMTSYQAAMGLVQLKKINKIINNKRRVAKLYNKYLSDIPGLKLPVELEWAKNVYWMYALTVEKKFGADRNTLMEYLHDNGIDTRTFFCPMSQQPAFKKIKGFKAIPCPVADKLWETGLYLPSSWNLSESTIKRIAASIKRCQKGK